MRGHQVLMGVDHHEHCIAVRCRDCSFRSSAETIAQASRACVAHIELTERGE